MASGAVHGIFNGLANIGSSISASRKLSDLLNLETLENFKKALTSELLNISYCFHSHLANLGYFPPLPKVDYKKSANLLENIKKGIVSNNDFILALPQLLITYHYELEFYIEVLSRLGDDNGALDKFAQYHNIDIMPIKRSLLQKEIENLSPEFVSQINQLNKNDDYHKNMTSRQIDDLLKAINAIQRKLGFDENDYSMLEGNISTLAKYHLRVGEFKHKYADINEAEVAQAEYQELLNVLASANPETDYQAYLNHNKQRKYVFVNADEYIKQMEDFYKTFEGIVYASVADKERAQREHQQLHNALANITDENLESQFGKLSAQRWILASAPEELAKLEQRIQKNNSDKTIEILKQLQSEIKAINIEQFHSISDYLAALQDLLKRIEAIRTYAEADNQIKTEMLNNLNASISKPNYLKPDYRFNKVKALAIQAGINTELDEKCVTHLIDWNNKKTKLDFSQKNIVAITKGTIALLDYGIMTNYRNIGYIPYKDIREVEYKPGIASIVLHLSTGTEVNIENTENKENYPKFAEAIRSLLLLDWQLIDKLMQLSGTSAQQGYIAASAKKDVLNTGRKPLGRLEMISYIAIFVPSFGMIVPLITMLLVWFIMFRNKQLAFRLIMAGNFNLLFLPLQYYLRGGEDILMPLALHSSVTAIPLIVCLIYYLNQYRKNK